MMGQRYGRVINMSSVSGLIGNAGQTNYSATKAGMIGFTRSLSKELAKRKITVNAVAPGFTLTEGLQAAIDRGDRDPAEMSRPTAMNKLVMPDEVADGIGFLLSDAARAITGIIMPIDAGWLCGSSWEAWGGMKGPRT
jgi:3-oxoacyl-[acyl-carrier protein] reductase